MSVLRSLLRSGNNVGYDKEIDQAFLLISDVAERVELEPKTIRFYEKAGLLKPRRLGQLRVFAISDVEVLLLIKQLRQYGMPIAEVREALALHQQQCDEGDSRLQKMLKLQLEMLLLKHKELTQQIAVLNSTLSITPNERAA